MAPPSQPESPGALEEPLLDVDDIQGNILAGFNKDHQILVALAIRDVPAARTWLTGIAGEIATTREVLQFNALFRALRARRGGDPQGLAATWINIAFSVDGLRKLADPLEVDTIPDAKRAFRTGMPLRSAGLGDPTGEAEGSAKNWVIGGPGKVPDIFLIVASDDPAYLVAAVERVCPREDPNGMQPLVLWKEQGDTRPDLPGHEHFGFKDGISQPGVRGLISTDPQVYLTPRQIDPSDPRAADWGSPGNPLLWPGHFVLGYPFLDPQTRKVVGPLPLKQAWFRNGSFLVFRRLRQDVPAFRQFLQAASQELQSKPGFAQITPELFGAMVVGRWPNGAPLARVSNDDIALGANSWANNNFLYTQPGSPVLPAPGSSITPDTYPQAREDMAGLVCPHAAHIRKVNPRDQDSDLGDALTTLTLRLLRRGIPFGPPLPDPAPPDDKYERGLHFLSYQMSIAQQFELLTGDWINHFENPVPGGHDPIIGQNSADPTRARRLEIRSPDPNIASQTITLTPEWVIPTGGGYFFAPSLSAIRTRLCGP